MCPGWPQTLILPITASQVARITDMSNWCLALRCIIFDEKHTHHTHIMHQLLGAVSLCTSLLSNLELPLFYNSTSLWKSWFVHLLKQFFLRTSIICTGAALKAGHSITQDVFHWWLLFHLLQAPFFSSFTLLAVFCFMSAKGLLSWWTICSVYSLAFSVFCCCYISDSPL
jgi:hypothetical protein